MKKILQNLSIALIILAPIIFLSVLYILGSGGRISQFRSLPVYYKIIDIILQLAGLLWFIFTFKYFRSIRMKVEQSKKYILFMPLLYFLILIPVFNLLGRDLFKAYNCHASNITSDCKGFKK